jgi:hypothetical protein
LLTVHDKVGEALRADRIAIKARQIREGKKLRGSHRHRIQTRILEGDAYCVIEVPLVYFRK